MFSSQRITPFKIIFLLSLFCLSGWSAVRGVSPAPPAKSGPVSALAWQKQVASDPAVGTILPLEKISGLDKKPIWKREDGRALAVLFVQDCIDCTAGDWMTDWQQMGNRLPRVAAVIAMSDANSRQADLRKYQATHRRPASFIVGEEANLSRFCNAYFKPRIAFFDPQGRLAYLQSPQTNTKEALKEIQQLYLEKKVF